ncbi:unnamed protein product [Prorocentrum cordatum]|uniref:Uncharacterized protein n=1 Tax=Prorocentrum cordatum TaxID=2364126 RepID=A0ABN9P614_9DINO|nr:unnamed protein product [Polarella glacialis]
MLELLCGAGAIAAAVADAGHGAFGLDRRRSPLEDRVAPAFRSTVLGWIKSRAAVAVWLSAPCTGWICAWRHPLRSDRFIFGLPALAGTEQARAGAGIATVTIQRLLVCIAARVLVFLKDPRTSQLWLCPEFQRLFQSWACRHIVLRQYQHNASYNKATTIVPWHACSTLALRHRCTGKRGLYSRTDTRYESLDSSDDQGQKKTAVASAYQLPLAQAAAQCIVETHPIQPVRARHLLAMC